jgi:transposase InsO family protein
VRLEAVEFRRLVVEKGGTPKQTAELLGLSPRTLSEWARRLRSDDLRALPRGRPLKRTACSARAEVFQVLRGVEGAMGVRALWRRWPELARSEVEDLVGRFRLLEEKHRRLLLHELSWEVPGAVWGMDHAEPPSPLDGLQDAILSVRDLSTGTVLVWEGVIEATAEITCTILEHHFETDGAPLVLKADNGPAFTACETRRLLDRWGVTLLLSPVRRPQYNGAVESGIRWLKARTEAKAKAAGRAGQWTGDDLDYARHQTNRNSRSHKRGEPSREVLWRLRPRIKPQERQAFLDSVIEEESRALSAEKASSPERIPFQRLFANLRRQAIRRALMAHGILHIHRRGRIPLVLQSLFAAKMA